MLEKLDLTLTLDKATYKRKMPALKERLLDLQQNCWVAGLPVIVVFEGWDASGRGAVIRKLAASLDPRGFRLYPIRSPRPFEQKRPWMWRFWSKIPARGEWAIFDRSWYGRVMGDRMRGSLPESEWRRAYRDIVDFERTLTDDGYLIFKFFLHISREEQRLRFEKLEKSPKSANSVTLEDWTHHRHYGEWLPAYEEALERTDTEWAPWTLVEAADKRHARVKVFESLVEVLTARLPAVEQPGPAAAPETADSVLPETPAPVEEGRIVSEDRADVPEPPAVEVNAPEETAPRQAGEAGTDSA